MAGKERAGSGLQREAPPVLMTIAAVLLAIVIGAAGFYVYNGGWKTAAQQDQEYKHNLLPIMAAKHGDMGPLEAENRLRKAHGEAPLELPKDKPQIGGSRQRLLDLQKQLAAHQGGQ